MKSNIDADELKKVQDAIERNGRHIQILGDLLKSGHLSKLPSEELERREKKLQDARHRADKLQSKCEDVFREAGINIPS
jgi:hypothetical protein